jgi:hypothetical protein
MDVEQIKMDPEIAKVHYQRYRGAVAAAREERLAKAKESITETGRALREARKKRSLIEKEDEELKKAYHALSKGKTLINVPRVLEQANLDPDNQLPNLAIAMADWKWCYLLYVDRWRQKEGTRHIWFAKERSVYNYRQNATKGRIAFDRDLFPAELWNQDWRRKNGFKVLGSRTRALVPTIPPHLRPDKLDNLYILWDAVWEEEPPVDPILLSKVNDTMFAVVAQWDLTELEQQVLEGRFR